MRLTLTNFDQLFDLRIKLEVSIQNWGKLQVKFEFCNVGIDALAILLIISNEPALLIKNDGIDCLFIDDEQGNVKGPGQLSVIMKAASFFSSFLRIWEQG